MRFCWNWNSVACTSVPGSDHQDILSWVNSISKLMPFRFLSLIFILICLNNLVFLLLWDLTASGFALVSKEWYTKHGMMEKTKIVVRITRHSAFDYWQVRHRRLSWIPTEKLKTRTKLFSIWWQTTNNKQHLDIYRVYSKTVPTWLFALLLASTYANC